MRVTERIGPGERVAGPENIMVPPGYVVEPFIEGLNFPTAISWDLDRFMLIAESQFPYGRSTPIETRVVRRHYDGSLETIATSFNSPINDITVYNGMLYVSHRGKISVVADGNTRDLITGLPSWGLHQNNTVVFDAAGRMYFSQGTVTNAGVVGQMEVGMLQQCAHLSEHDIPGADVVLTGKSFEVTNPMSKDTRMTGAFVPWGTQTAEGQRVLGARPRQATSGAIMSANFDGADLRVHAWGFRNPFGLAFDANGRLYATNNGAAPMAPRMIANDPDTFWLVEEGTWYGWPDFYDGKPVTDPAFRAPGAPPHSFLTANHNELLKGRGSPPQPVVRFDQNASADGFDFCLHPDFGFDNQAFVAQFGPMLAVAAGSAPPDLPAGRKVVRVDLEHRTVTDFATNQDGRYPSSNGNSGGLERPVAAKFGPEGHLYIVDYGVMEWVNNQWEATPGTGAIWKVRPTGR